MATALRFLGAIAGVALIFAAAHVFSLDFDSEPTILGETWQGFRRMQTPVGAALSILGVAALLLGLRHACLRWRARKPRVQITTFDWTGATEVAQPEAAWVTSLFRNELSALQLDALDALPERAPGSPLMEIVAGVGHGSSVSKAIVGLYKIVNPACAYIVWGTLRPHKDRSGGFISVELVDRSRADKSLISVTHEADDWGDCTRQAAMAIAGAVYPRVHHSHQGPWTRWTHSVPSELVMDYHAAADFERTDRLEEAIGTYKRALVHDPLNPHLRICIAMIQERLGLYLDAWSEYQAITADADPSAWRGVDRRVHLVALYRLGIILGYGRAGDQWMRHEGASGRRTQRDSERQVLRAELALALVDDKLFTEPGQWDGKKVPLDTANASDLWREFLTRLKKLQLAVVPEAAARDHLLALLCGGDPTKTDGRGDWPFLPDDKIAARPGVSADSRFRVDLINELLQILALRHLEELKAWLRPLPRLRPRPWRDVKRWRVHRPRASRTFARQEIAPIALELSFTCMRLRLRATRYFTIDPEEDRDAFASILRRPPFSEFPDKRVNVTKRRLRRVPRHHVDDWLTHYNAACTVAVPLIPAKRPPTIGQPLPRTIPLPLPDDDPQAGDPKAGDPTVRHEQQVTRLVETAVEHLERYAQKAGSPRVASQEGWIGAEDPDLAGLTEREEFRRWARHHLSHRLPKRRPVRSVDVAYHLRYVLGCGAQAMAEEWRRRAHTSDTPAEEVEKWWREEERMWKVALDACLEFRSWPKRLLVVEAVNEQLAAAGQQQVDKSPSWRERTGQDENYHQNRLHRIADVVRPVHEATIPERPAVPEWVREHHEGIWEQLEGGAVRIGDGLSETEEREAALHLARLWRRLAQAADPAVADAAAEGAPDQADAVEAQFRADLEALEREAESLATPERAPAVV